MLNIEKFDMFSSVSEIELEKIIKARNSKSCVLDPVPTTLLKEILPCILPTLQCIVNRSLSTCEMPTCLKTAVVTPILKKSNMDAENLKSYRPVSNLPYLGKLIEKIAVKQIDNHLEQNDLLEPLQSAYRANHSTETALLKITGDILQFIDSGKCVLLVLLDMSAAFDTVDYQIFIDRLCSENGVDGNVKSWMTSYLSERTQTVRIIGNASDPVKLSCGLPQGSYIGPTGFKLYIKPIVQIAKSYGISIHQYADDTQLYIEFEPGNVNEVKSKMELCIAEMKQWLTVNYLKLNTDKTEVIVIGSRYKLSQVPDVSLIFENDEILPKHHVKNIGVIFDEMMSMSSQVNNVCKSCYNQLRYLSQIRRYLTDDAIVKLVHAFITSRLDGINSILFGVPTCLIDKLQKIQNNCARLILRLKKSDHITEGLKELHWLPIVFRIEYKLIILIFKCIHDIAPLYLSEQISVYVPPRNLRSGSKYLLNLTKTKTVYGDRAFKNCAPKLFNSLPLILRTSAFNSELSGFKVDLKTYLFQKAYL